MGYITPVPSFQYYDYHIRMIKDKVDYVQYFPVQKLYNERRELDDFDRFQVKTSHNNSARKPYIRKGMYLDVYV